MRALMPRRRLREAGHFDWRVDDDETTAARTDETPWHDCDQIGALEKAARQDPTRGLVGDEFSGAAAAMRSARMA